MKVTLFESVSVNGMMGRPEGQGDFFSDPCWHGFVAETRATGALIWGRNTHDQLRRWDKGFEQLSGLHSVVLTSRSGYDPGPGWRTAASPRDALALLEKDGVSETFVAGGQTVNTAFLEEKLLDEIVLYVESVLIGRGMPLFAPTDAEQRLTLLDARRETDTVLRLHYRVMSG